MTELQHQSQTISFSKELTSSKAKILVGVGDEYSEFRHTISAVCSQCGSMCLLSNLPLLSTLSLLSLWPLLAFALNMVSHCGHSLH